MKLSEAQRAMLRRLNSGPEESPYGMGRRSAVASSAWHRTAKSLEREGLVVLERYGDHYRARLVQTWPHT